MQGVDTGFNPENILTLSLNLPSLRYGPQQIPTFLDQLLERLSALPGVTLVASTSQLPLTGAGATLIYAIDGRIPATMQEWPNAQIRWVTPGLFQTLQIALLQGREFTNQDRNPAPGHHY